MDDSGKAEGLSRAADFASKATIGESEFRNLLTRLTVEDVETKVWARLRTGLSFGGVISGTVVAGVIGAVSTWLPSHLNTQVNLAETRVSEKLKGEVNESLKTVKSEVNESLKTAKSEIGESLRTVNTRITEGLQGLSRLSEETRGSIDSRLRDATQALSTSMGDERRAIQAALSEAMRGAAHEAARLEVQQSITEVGRVRQRVQGALPGIVGALLRENSELRGEVERAVREQLEERLKNEDFRKEQDVAFHTQQARNSALEVPLRTSALRALLALNPAGTEVLQLLEEAAGRLPNAPLDESDRGVEYLREALDTYAGHRAKRNAVARAALPEFQQHRLLLDRLLASLPNGPKILGAGFENLVHQFDGAEALRWLAEAARTRRDASEAHRVLVQTLARHPGDAATDAVNHLMATAEPAVRDALNDELSRRPATAGGASYGDGRWAWFVSQAMPDPASRAKLFAPGSCLGAGEMHRLWVLQALLRPLASQGTRTEIDPLSRLRQRMAQDLQRDLRNSSGPECHHLGEELEGLFRGSPSRLPLGSAGAPAIRLDWLTLHLRQPGQPAADGAPDAARHAAKFRWLLPMSPDGNPPRWWTELADGHGGASGILDDPGRNAMHLALVLDRLRLAGQGQNWAEAARAVLAAHLARDATGLLDLRTQRILLAAIADARNGGSCRGPFDLLVGQQSVAALATPAFGALLACLRQHDPEGGWREQAMRALTAADARKDADAGALARLALYLMLGLRRAESDLNPEAPWPHFASMLLSRELESLPAALRAKAIAAALRYGGSPVADRIEQHANIVAVRDLAQAVAQEPAGQVYREFFPYLDRDFLDGLEASNAGSESSAWTFDTGQMPFTAAGRFWTRLDLPGGGRIRFPPNASPGEAALVVVPEPFRVTQLAPMTRSTGRAGVWPPAATLAGFPEAMLGSRGPGPFLDIAPSAKIFVGTRRQGQPGIARLQVEPPPENAAPAAEPEAELPRLALGRTYAAQIGDEGRQIFALELQRNQRYGMRTENLDRGLDTEIQVLDEDGIAVPKGYNDDGIDSEPNASFLRFQAPQSGLFFVQVSAFGGRGLERPLRFEFRVDLLPRLIASQR